jgi:2,4-dienoyl-CoA reductase-like NADH-dependent reductase (Old Yellow Enzyme family)
VAYEHVFAPLTMRGVRLRNRIVMTAHRKGLDMPYSPGPRELAYLAARAAGGAGLLVTEASPVHPTSFPHGEMNTPYDLGVVPRYRAVADAVHEYGTAIFGQIYHCGAEAINGIFSERALWGPSGLRGLGSEEMAHAMTTDEIDEVVAAFAAAALNFLAGGFDGIEIHGGHGYLIQQFLSPLTNRRTDSYGGSLENRMRFAREVIAAVRAAVGPDIPVGLRVSADERLGGGLGVPQMQQISATLTTTGSLDYLSVSNGTHESYAGLVPSAAKGFGEMAEYAAAIKPHVAIPVLAAGRVHTPGTAERILAAGHADLVGMLRALIADPDLPAKMARGDEDEIRPCIAVNYCLKRVHQSAEIRCAVNPAVGFESAQLPPSVPRRIAVVGAGPGGLEAACTAAERGHLVTLFELTDRIGGMFAVACAFPNKIGSARLLTYFERRLIRAGVELRLGSSVTGLDDLTGYDAIVLATGAESVRSPWPDRHSRYGEACDDPRIFRGSFTDLLELDVSGEHVVLVESEMTDYPAATLAAYLGTRVRRLTAVTSYERFGAGLDRPSADTVTQSLAAAAVYTSSWLDLENGTAAVHRLLRRRFPLDDVDRVIVTGPRRPSLPAGLEALPEVLLVGDCVAPRGVSQAIAEGHRIADRLGVPSAPRAAAPA